MITKKKPSSNAEGMTLTFNGITMILLAAGSVIIYMKCFICGHTSFSDDLGFLHRNIA